MPKIAKLIIRTLLGLVVGILSGAVICGLEFALLGAIGGNRSLGGIGTIENSILFSALIGALAGSFYAAIVGATNGLVGAGPMRGAMVGAAIAAVVAVYLFSRSNDPGVDSALVWIFVTGGILGLATGSVLALLTKKITWLSK